MKKYLSVFLALVMCVSLLAIPASATGAIYTVGGKSTVYLSTESTVSIGGNTYHTYQKLDTAIAALGGAEGEVILCSDITATGGDTTAFIDTAGRKAVTIKGLTGNETFTIDGTFEFKGDTTLDNMNFKFTTTKYLNGFSNTTFGENFKVSSNSGAIYFATASIRSLSSEDISVTVNGGKFNAFNVSGNYMKVPAGSSVTATLNGGTLDGINLGMGEKQTAHSVNGNVNLVINKDVIKSKIIDFMVMKTDVFGANSIVTVIMNDGINYTLSDNAKRVTDLVVKSDAGGKVSIQKNGGAGEAPTLLIAPDEGKVPFVNGQQLAVNSTGEYVYTPTLSGAQTMVQITFELGTTSPKTVYVSIEPNVTIDGITYNAYQKLDTAIAALGGAEGEVILCSDITATGGDTTAFIDTAGRKAVTIKGLTGNETFTIDGTWGFKGDTILDNMNFRFTATKYLNGFSNTTFGENFKVASGSGQIYFATANERTLSSEDISVTVNGGKFNAFNVSGNYMKVPAGSSVTATLNGGTLDGINLGMGEKQTAHSVNGNVNLVINKDVVKSKIIDFMVMKTDVFGANSIVTVIMNDGINYTLSDNAKRVTDLVVKSGAGGKVSIQKNGGVGEAPTLLLTPNEGKFPFVNGSVVNSVDGVYTYALTTPTALTEVTVEWLENVVNNKNIMLDTRGISAWSSTDGYDYLYYGADGNKWRVLDTNTNIGTDGLFLLSENLQGKAIRRGGVYFDRISPYYNIYQGSDAQAWCDTFEVTKLSETELAAIIQTTKSDDSFKSSLTKTPFSAVSNILNNDQVFFLSAEEAENSAYGLNDTTRKGTLNGEAGAWWLRSPNLYDYDWDSDDGSDSDYRAGYVHYDGYVAFCDAGAAWAARPAFNLNRNAVLFTSAAKGGKISGEVGSGALREIAEYDGNEWKVTLKDASRGFSVSETSVTAEAGKVVTLNYTGANSGSNEYVSAILIDGSGNQLFYGNLVNNSASGWTTITIPADLEEGNYILKLFSEQLNGDYMTDYASEFEDVVLTVVPNKPEETMGTFGMSAGTIHLPSGSVVTDYYTDIAMLDGSLDGLEANSSLNIDYVDIAGEYVEFKGFTKTDAKTAGVMLRAINTTNGDKIFQINWKTLEISDGDTIVLKKGLPVQMGSKVWTLDADYIYVIESDSSSLNQYHIASIKIPDAPLDRDVDGNATVDKVDAKWYRMMLVGMLELPERVRDLNKDGMVNIVDLVYLLSKTNDVNE